MNYFIYISHGNFVDAQNNTVDCVLLLSLLSLTGYLLCHILYDRMFWTEQRDLILVREMLANSPFAGTKSGTVQRGRKWNEITEHLLQVEAPKFKVDQRR